MGRSTCRHDGAIGGTVLLSDDENWNRTRHRGGNDLPQAGHSTRRHDGTAAIPDFKPRLGNRCNNVVHSGDFRAAIPDFRPRIANRCSQKVESGAIRASILDFKPKLANRCSQKAKTGAIRAVIPDFRPRIGNRCQRRGQNRGNPSRSRE